MVFLHAYTLFHKTKTITASTVYTALQLDSLGDRHSGASFRRSGEVQHSHVCCQVDLYRVLLDLWRLVLFLGGLVFLSLSSSAWLIGAGLIRCTSSIHCRVFRTSLL